MSIEEIPQGADVNVIPKTKRKLEIDQEVKLETNQRYFQSHFQTKRKLDLCH